MKYPVKVRFDRKHKTWVIDVTWPDGIRERSRRQSEGEAGDDAIRMKAAILDGTWQELRGTLGRPGAQGLRFAGTFEQFTEVYISLYCDTRNTKSLVSKKSRLQVLSNYFGKMRLCEIQVRDVDSYVAARRAAGISAATINRDLSVLRHCLSWAVSRDYLSRNVMERVEELPEPEWDGQKPSQEIIEAVLAACSETSRPVFEFLYETACRREEALCLERRQVDRVNSTVNLPDHIVKTEGRIIPLNERALRAIDAQPPVSKYVFYNPRTKDRWSDLRKPWLAARRKAGFPWLRVHDLRRGLAIDAVDRGVRAQDVQALLGHRQISTTEHYYRRWDKAAAARNALRLVRGGSK